MTNEMINTDEKAVMTNIPQDVSKTIVIGLGFGSILVYFDTFQYLPSNAA